MHPSRSRPPFLASMLLLSRLRPALSAQRAAAAFLSAPLLLAGARALLSRRAPSLLVSTAALVPPLLVLPGGVPETAHADAVYAPHSLMQLLLGPDAAQPPWASPLLLMSGLSKKSGKNKRPLKRANHGARPCNHVGRKSRQIRGTKYRNIVGQ